MTRHYPNLGSTSGENVQPIRSTHQIWVVTRHQNGISALTSQTLLRWEISGGRSRNVGCFLRLGKAVNEDAFLQGYCSLYLK